MALKLFISYSHKDEDLKDELDKFLIGLKRSEQIEVWQDRKLLGGDLWDDTIAKELVEADIILLLVSQDFISSEYIWEKELKISIARHKENKACVIPIILRPCDWTDMPFAKLQALPWNAKAVTLHVNRDEVCTQIAQEIKKVVSALNSVLND